MQNRFNPSLRRISTALALAAIIFAVSCGSNGNKNANQNGNNGGNGALISVASDGSTTIDNQRVQAAVTALPAGQLTSEEEAGLVYMREEEKLARDVYAALAPTAAQPIFANIGASEQTHMDAVKVLLDRYGIADPAASTAAGQFVNPDLQKLYNDLVAQGSVSLEQALRAGALIEEIDIVDLDGYLKQTNEQAIKLVYDNLENGSRNHLRAFVNNLQHMGIDYQPVRLSTEAYDAIMANQ
jgi:hypothetical protein